MIQLSLPTQDAVWKDISNDTVDVKVLILYPYYVEADANGNSFNITKEDVFSIYEKYNKSVKFKWSKLQKLGKEIPLRYVENIANILDHDPRANNVVGRVIGELDIIEKEDKPYLFATLRVKGKENVERVKDGRFSQVSMGFDPVTHDLFEISWVVNGAIPGAQAILSNGTKTTINTVNTNNPNEYSHMNILRVKTALLSEYERNRKILDDKEKDIEIVQMLTSLQATGKILPKDKVRYATEFKRIENREARLSAFNLLSENLRNVVDYSTKSRNQLSINWEENLMSGKKTAMLDLSNIAARAAAELKKGKMKAKFEEREDDAEMSEEDEDEHEKSEREKGSKKSEFTKKDLKHCMSLSDKEELGKYLSTFLSEEMDDETEYKAYGDDKEAAVHEKEKGKFSKEIKSLQEESNELKKQNVQILEKLALLSENTEKSQALFSEIVAKYSK